jgi:hypothetical protein
MSENQASLLTERQRGYLRGEVEPSNESQMKGRIRERVYSGLRNDSGILLDQLPAEQRRDIFRNWENNQNTKVPQEVDFNPIEQDFEKSTLQIELSHLLAFLYIGIEESELDSFAETLKSGLSHAARERNQYVSEFDLHVDFEERATGEEIYNAVKEGEIELDDLTVTQVQKMLRSDSTDIEELPNDIETELTNFFDNFESLRESFAKLSDK